MKKLLLLLVGVMLAFYLSAQVNNPPNSPYISTKQTSGSHKVDTAVEAARKLWEKNPKKALELAKEAVSLAQLTNYRRGLAHAWVCLGDFLLTQGDYPLAYQYYWQARQVYENSTFLTYLAEIDFKLARVWEHFGAHQKALHYLHLARLNTSPKKRKHLALIWYQSAEQHKEIGLIDSAMICYEKSLGIYTQIGALEHQMKVLKALAQLSHRENDWGKSEEYWSKYLSLARLTFNKAEILRSKLYLGKAMMHKGEMKKAEKLIKQAVREDKNLATPQVSVELLMGLASVYTQQERRGKALGIYKKAYKLSQDIPVLPLRKQVLEAYIQSLEKAGNNDSLVYYYQELSTVLKAQENQDTQLRRDSGRKVLNLQVWEEKQKAELSDQAFQKKTSYTLIGLLSFCFFLTLNVLRNNRQKQKINQLLKLQNEEIRAQGKSLKQHNQELIQKHHEIQLYSQEILQKNDALRVKSQEIQKKSLKMESSIRYAKRIQEALLPMQDKMKQSLSDLFILLKPRDIVSGDFYWFAETQSKFKTRNGQAPQAPGKSDKVFLAAVDCTGHGIPGAFMSMMANEMLDHIILERRIEKPDLVLNHLHKSVRKALKQAQTDNRDGMDMSLVVIDRVHNTLEFSGARNPLLIIQNGCIRRIKGDIMPIGGVQPEPERKFKRISIQLDHPTTLYMLSDGYQDQFGGNKGKKFRLKRLESLLLEIHREPMERQKQILDETLSHWMRGKYSQIDDILLMGVRVFPEKHHKEPVFRKLLRAYSPEQV